MNMNYPFEVDHIDRWGNAFVICPICKEVRKKDGIIRHAQRSEGHEKFVIDYNEHAKIRGPVKVFVSKSVGKPVPQSPKNKDVTKRAVGRRAFYNVKRKPLS